LKGIDAEFEMDAGTVVKRENRLPVFEVKVDKAVVLHDQDRDLVLQERQVVSVDQVNGPYIQIGFNGGCKKYCSKLARFIWKRKTNSKENTRNLKLSIQVRLNGLSFCIRDSSTGEIIWFLQRRV
jgi:hypothetical protein